MNEATIDRWVRPVPRFTITVLALSLVVPIAVVLFEYCYQWTPLQQHYLLTYFFTSYSGRGRYRALGIEYPRGLALANDADVVPARTQAGEPPLHGNSVRPIGSGQAPGREASFLALLAAH